MLFASMIPGWFLTLFTVGRPRKPRKLRRMSAMFPDPGFALVVEAATFPAMALRITTRNNPPGFRGVTTSCTFPDASGT